MSRWSLALLALCGCASAIAQSVIEARDGAIVKVSLNQPNLVEASAGRITAFVFTEGKFTEKIDPESGVLYFRPLEQGTHSGFIEVSSGGGQGQRFNLVLVSDETIAAQRIVLRPAGAEELSPAVSQPHQPLASRHLAQIKQLLREMLIAKADTLSRTEPERLVIGDALVLTKLAKLERGALIGEMLSLRNHGSNAADLNEAMLHVRDDIVAIVISASALAPGARETVYLVRARKDAGQAR